jgi:hypothetical protein
MKQSHIVSIAACAALILGSITSSAFAADKQKKNKVESKAQTARGNTDPNIKTPELPANDPSQADAKKPEAKRGACRVTVDSYRNLYIKIFVDGDYKGVVSPLATDYTYAISGPTRLYARADFTDGSYSFWGPETFYCEDGGSYTWTLR